MNREFNLLDEAWICVRAADCKVKEISLKDVFIHAHEYVDLAGETKTQDFAVLRLILAVMYTVFSRYDTEGNEITYYSEDQAFDLWEDIWNNGRLPAMPVEKYFEKWHDRFWLFDDEFPFYQSPTVKGKPEKPIKTSKMIGTLFESDNKNRHFIDRTRNNRNLSYGEAARWLIHLICFDDRAAKAPVPKMTWVAKLGLIALRGKNLFETIMMNFNAIIDVGKACKPAWENVNHSTEYNKLIAIPDNQAELLTIQSRQVYLCREKGMVTSYYMGGGDYFDENDVHSEQMTLWKRAREKKNSPIQYKPEVHNPERMAWREFDSIVALKEGDRNPGIILWIEKLVQSNIISRDYMVDLVMAAVVYDLSQPTSLPVIDLISDELTFNSCMLLSMGESWRMYVSEEISKCDEAAGAVWSLSKSLQIAAGNSESKDHKVTGGKDKQKFYQLIDHTLRNWIASIRVDDDETEKLAEIENKILKKTIDFGHELADGISNSSIIGRSKKGDVCSSAKAMNEFARKIYGIFNRAGDKI